MEELSARGRCDISTATVKPSQPLGFICYLIYRKYLLWPICLHLCLYYICHIEKKKTLEV